MPASSPSSSPPAAAPPERPWERPADDVLGSLGVNRERGLSPGEAEDRLRRFGPNLLREHERRSAWEILVDQFRSIIVVLLGAAAALSFLFGAHVEGLAILAVLALNAAIGFATELRAVTSMEALRELGQVTTRVLRDGEQEEVPAERLVPGDLVPLDGGDVITADMRLVEASRLQTSEAALTGESVPVEKDVEAVSDDTPLSDRRSMAYKGTAVTRGSGLGVVVATGMETELGTISALVEEAEEETTPLEQRLDQLGQRLVWVTLVLAAVVAVSGILVGKDVLLIVETAIALAVAAIPEGLPIVATIALARGMWRMATRNALVERLSAVETLGSTSVILTDKTGTLTENRMTVVRLALPCREEELELEDEEPPETAPASRQLLELLEDGASAGPTRRADLLLLAGALCNNASLSAGENEGAEDDEEAMGDPTEVALLRAARDRGLPRRRALEELPELAEDAFDPDVKMMATFHGDEASSWVFVKGAPEAVVDAATHELADDGPVALTDASARAWLDRNRRLAEDGLRILGVAARPASPDEEPYRDLIFLGLVALLDPPRRDVRPSIEACESAGVRLVMVTGDQPATARNVAEALGLGLGATGPVLGSDLPPFDQMAPSARERFRGAGLFARTSPKQKLDLIALHQEAGDVVAMIGDGVNDAPALKKADIGVAMGQRGTQVAQEASDMILQDDRFPTIVAAIEQGRAIFENIRKFVVYLLSCNVSEILIVSLATLVNAPLPILPLQILFLNLVTDVFPALALGVGEGDPSLMERPPRPSDESVLTRRHWYVIGSYGVVLTASVLTALWVALGPLGLRGESAVTVSFLVLAFGQLWHVFNMADTASGVLLNEVTKNPWVWGAVVLCVLLLMLALYLPPLAEVLDLVPPDATSWTVVLGLSATPLVAGRGARLVGLGLSSGRR